MFIRTPAAPFRIVVGWLLCIELQVQGLNNGTTVDVPDDIASNLIGAELDSDFIGISSSFGDYLKLFGNHTAELHVQPWAIPLLQTLKTCSECKGPRIRINGDQGGAKPWYHSAMFLETIGRVLITVVTLACYFNCVCILGGDHSTMHG